MCPVDGVRGNGAVSIALGDKGFEGVQRPSIHATGGHMGFIFGTLSSTGGGNTSGKAQVAIWQR